MPNNWTLRGTSTIYEVATSFDRRAADALPARVVDSEIDAWVRDPFTSSVLVEMLREVGLLGWMPPTNVGGLVRDAFARRLLCIVGLTEERGGGAGRVEGKWGDDDEQPVTGDEPPVEDKALDWIEIALVDEDDAPVSYAQYSIELPDGSTREGRLDAMGFARIENIDPGTCKVSFPNIDGREWGAA